MKMLIEEIIRKNEEIFGCPVSDLPPGGGTESLLAVKKARRLAPFTDAAVVEFLHPIGGGPDPDSRRGFGPTGHWVRVSEDELSVEFAI